MQKIWNLLVNMLNLKFVGAASDRKVVLSDAKSEENIKKKPQRIRCPICGWLPDGKPYWGCEKCFAQFDTFKTHAHCPTCGNSWTFTQCIACGTQSPHDEWYENLE
jgi:DNA-directed RNA polymerase subunit RPC12/RpoP